MQKQKKNFYNARSSLSNILYGNERVEKMKIIIETQFKDTHQTHYINKEHTDDSLRRIRVKEDATRFSCRSEAKLFLDNMAIDNQRFDECTYSYIEVDDEINND
jgi:hypothetical protein